MIKNYFLVAWRNLIKHKGYSTIKIGGLALSIGMCFLIALYIKDELSYDKSWNAASRIFRISSEFHEKGDIILNAEWPAPMAKAIAADFPEVEKAGRLLPDPSTYGAGSNQMRTGDQEENTFEEGFTYADKDMLDMLDVNMIYGDKKQALAEPNTIVITKRKADKYFPNINPVGKTIILNNDKAKPYTVSGVIENLPANSHLRYDFLLTLTDKEFWPGEQNLWLASNYFIYVLLKPGTDVKAFESKLKLIATKYVGPALRDVGNVIANDVERKTKYYAQPISDIHLYSADIGDDLKKGDIRFIWLFGGVACFILIIACINFINLSTAKSANRAKEVSVRRVVGSFRSSLIIQFLIESLLYSILSFIIGLLVATLLLPYFNTVSAKSLTVPWSDWKLWPIVIGGSAAVGILAGLYPSFYLSAFKPIKVLKGDISRGSRNTALRNSLVVFQFTTSIVLIISTLVIYNQTKFILNRKIGFDKDQVLMIRSTDVLADKTPAFKEELKKLSQIKSVTVSDYLPIDETKREGNIFWKEGKSKEEDPLFAQKWQVDDDYLETMGMKIIEGRNFSKELASDSAAIIINKNMVERLGLKNPVGQRIENGWQHFTVVGVVDDFNFESMRMNVYPLSLIPGNNKASVISVKISSADMKDALASISAVWKKFVQNQSFRYSFMDERFANMYADVQRTGIIFTSFAVFAIIIACLGLFALSAFIAEQCTKEIGIRKVLGASVNGIVAMLSKDFLKLVAISIVIATPIAWWAMSKWLEDFAYRITVSWTFAAIAGIIALLTALITVSMHAIKAAIANPVKSLRSE